jgi:hypothetical protein
MDFSNDVPRVKNVVRVSIGGLYQYEAAVICRYHDLNEQIIILDIPNEVNSVLPRQLARQKDSSWLAFPTPDIPPKSRIQVQIIG